MIALDLSHPNYQNMLIIYLKFIAKDVEIKTANIRIGLKDLKITNFLIDVVSVRKKQLSPINELIKKIPNTYKIYNNGINKFILLLRKGVYPYQYMDSWERFDEISLHDETTFYRELYLKNIFDEDYIYSQKIFNEFEIKSLDEYHDLLIKKILYCLLMYLRTFQINALKCINLILVIS